MIFAVGPGSFVFSPRAIILHVRTFRGNNGRWEEFSSRVRRSRPVCIIPGAREGAGGSWNGVRLSAKNKKPWRKTVKAARKVLEEPVDSSPRHKREDRPPLSYGFLLPPHVFPFLFFLRSLFKGAKLSPSFPLFPPQPRSLFVPDCLLAGTFSKTNWPVASLNTKLDRLMTDFGLDSLDLWSSLPGDGVEDFGRS